METDKKLLDIYLSLTDCALRFDATNYHDGLSDKKQSAIFSKLSKMAISISKIRKQIKR